MARNLDSKVDLFGDHRMLEVYHSLPNLLDVDGMHSQQRVFKGNKAIYHDLENILVIVGICAL